MSKSNFIPSEGEKLEGDCKQTSDGVRNNKKMATTQASNCRPKDNSSCRKLTEAAESYGREWDDQTWPGGLREDWGCGVG